jgi:hypothetical protein
MSRGACRCVFVALLVWAGLTAGCGGSQQEALLPAETFSWVRQPIAFAPPPSRWERQGDNGGGTLGVRFILRGGGGQVISVAAYRRLAERDRRAPLARLVTRRDSLSQHEFLRELSLVRPPTDDPISEREAETARAINQSIDRASSDYLAGSMGFVASDLDIALQAATRYQPTLEELLPHIRLDPGRSQGPIQWRIGYERDTVIAGLPVFASDDTLITPEQTLLYHEIFWAVNGCAFKATFQGRLQNLDTFHRVVDSIRFPEPKDGPAK